MPIRGFGNFNLGSIGLGNNGLGFNGGGDVVSNALAAAFGGNPVPTGPINVLQNYLAGNAYLSGNQYAYQVLPQASPLSQFDQAFMQQQHTGPFDLNLDGRSGMGVNRFSAFG